MNIGADGVDAHPLLRHLLRQADRHGVERRLRAGGVHVSPGAAVLAATDRR
jgi:hypothetical protein